MFLASVEYPILNGLPAQNQAAVSPGWSFGELHHPAPLLFYFLTMRFKKRRPLFTRVARSGPTEEAPIAIHSKLWRTLFVACPQIVF